MSTVAIPSTAIEQRYLLARDIARKAGQQAYQWFCQRDSLVIESKGLQDMVSAADKDTESLIRAAVSAECPEDGFLGEEGGLDHGDADFLWVIDPIDGTACFVNGMHSWCLSIAVMHAGKPVIGVVYDPNADEMFHACAGHGAFVNAQRLQAHAATSVRDGVLGVGFSHRVPVSSFVPFLDRVLTDGGMFIRNGSGALMLAYVAAGRLIGYYEPHINAWDCLAAIVLVQEAGGRVNDFLSDEGLHKGNPIIAAGADFYEELVRQIQPG